MRGALSGPVRGAARTGIIGALVLVGVLSLLFLLSVRPFASGDESAHAAYGLTLVREGRLPTLFETIEPSLQYQQVKPQHVANHPPLYYLLVGPLLSLGLSSGHPLAGYLAARAVSVLGALALVGLVAAFAHALTRGRRPALVVGAAAVTASYAPLIAVSGVLHNDTLAVAASAALLWLVVRVLRRGPTRGMVVAIALTGLVACSVRANNAVVLLVACLAVVASAVLDAPPARRWTSGLVRGLVSGGVVGLTSVAGIGWFYWRSQRLYGNAMGYGVIAPQFGNVPVPTEPGALLHDPTLLLRLLGLPQPAGMTSWVGLLELLPVVAVLVGLLVLAVRWVVRRRGSGDQAAPENRERATRVVLVVLFLLLAAVTVWTVSGHVDAGGGARVRYLFPLLPVVAVVAVRALQALPGGARGVPVTLVVAAGVLTSLHTVADASWGWWEPRRPSGPIAQGIDRGLSLMGVGWSGGVLVLAFVVLAAAVVAVAAGSGNRGSGVSTDADAEPVHQRV